MNIQIIIKVKDIAMADKGKPYFIELYASDNTLVNKYKFVFSVKTINELKDKIVEKLEAKGQLAKDDKVAIKDTSDFELGSDD